MAKNSNSKSSSSSSGGGRQYNNFWIPPLGLVGTLGRDPEVNQEKETVTYSVAVNGYNMGEETTVWFKIIRKSISNSGKPALDLKLRKGMKIFFTVNGIGGSYYIKNDGDPTVNFSVFFPQVTFLSKLDWDDEDEEDEDGDDDYGDDDYGDENNSQYEDDDEEYEDLEDMFS